MIGRIDPQMMAESRARARAERQLELLGELAEIGLEVARAVERRAKDPAPDQDLNLTAMAYARVARAVRLTVMLQSGLMEQLRRIDDRADIRDRFALAADPRLGDPDYAHKARVERIVERIAQAQHEDERVVDRLVVEAHERLDDEDLYGLVRDRPVGELVALICRDLGLSPDWSRLAEEAWAQSQSPPPKAAGGGPLAEERAGERESGAQDASVSPAGDTS
jgi:hypothetical protein